MFKAVLVPTVLEQSCTVFASRPEDAGGGGKPWEPRTEQRDYEPRAMEHLSWYVL